MSRLIRIYDTTLREGTQGEGVSFSMEDKVRLTTRLDALGIHYIEGGWPGSNPKDLRFFRRMQDVPLKHARLAAFSMTRRTGGTAETDANMAAILDAGAAWIILCDTNGGTLPFELVEIIREVRRHVRTPLGIHVHNDAECAVANPLAAVREGCDQVQGTLNGYGERCGNANLVSVIPGLVLKVGIECIPAANLHELRDVSRFASELANRKPWDAQPCVGDSAFAHKGGMHVSAVVKHPETYEHIEPEAVGNHRRVLVSELGALERALEGARVRHRHRPGDAGDAADPRGAQGARGPGVPVRGRGGVVRAPHGARARATQAVLRAPGLPRDRGGGLARAAGGRGDRAREGHRGAHGGDGQRPRT